MCIYIYVVYICVVNVYICCIKCVYIWYIYSLPRVLFHSVWFFLIAISIKNGKFVKPRGVLKSDCNDCNDLNATLSDASEVSPPQKRSKGKPYEFLKSFSTFDEAFESFGVLSRLREHKWTKHSIKCPIIKHLLADATYKLLLEGLPVLRI